MAVVVSLALYCNVADSHVGVNPVLLSLPRRCFLMSNLSVNEIECTPAPLCKGMER